MTINACTSTFSTTVMHPGEIAIPRDMDSIIIIDRTKSVKKGTKVGKVVEGIFTGEPIGGDVYGVDKTMIYLLQVLHKNERVTLVHGEPIEVLNINGTLEYEIPIRSEVIDSFAKKYGADGVISLEFFDSDKTYVGNGQPNNTASFVRTYWRLYFPNDHSIIDEMSLSTYGNSNYQYSGIIPQGYSSITKAGTEAADRYIKRILPSLYFESRMYYTKGCEELKISSQFIKSASWDKAKFVLEDGLNTEYSNKILGRLAYNLSVVCEQLEEFDKALDWAYKSAETGNSNAPKLIQIIRTRINEKSLLDEQSIRE